MEQHLDTYAWLQHNNAATTSWNLQLQWMYGYYLGNGALSEKVIRRWLLYPWMMPLLCLQMHYFLQTEY